MHTRHRTSVRAADDTPDRATLRESHAAVHDRSEQIDDLHQHRMLRTTERERLVAGEQVAERVAAGAVGPASQRRQATAVAEHDPQSADVDFGDIRNADHAHVDVRERLAARVADDPGQWSIHASSWTVATNRVASLCVSTRTQVPVGTRAR